MAENGEMVIGKGNGYVVAYDQEKKEYVIRISDDPQDGTTKAGMPRFAATGMANFYNGATGDQLGLSMTAWKSA